MSKSTYEDVLKELEESYNEGKIGEATYMELRDKYIKQMENDFKGNKEPETFISYKSMGGHSVSSDTMKFSGAARLPGGVVPRFVRVSGACKIKDDIEVNGIHCSGLLRSAGSIISHGDIHVSGAFRAKRDVSAEGKVNVSGMARVKGEFSSTGAITVSGAMRALGSITGKEGIKVSGRARTDGNLHSDRNVEVKGSVIVSGNVVADNIKFTAANDFRRFLRGLWRSKVEGDVLGKGEVLVDNIHVYGNLRGRVVKIGFNSRIDGYVYYVDDLIIDNDVVLKNQPIKVSAHDLGISSQPHIPIREKVPTAGEPLKLKFCPKCGQDVGESKKFCAACGSKLQ